MIQVHCIPIPLLLNKIYMGQSLKSYVDIAFQIAEFLIVGPILYGNRYGIKKCTFATAFQENKALPGWTNWGMVIVPSAPSLRVQHRVVDSRGKKSRPRQFRRGIVIVPSARMVKTKLSIEWKADTTLMDIDALGMELYDPTFVVAWSTGVKPLRFEIANRLAMYMILERRLRKETSNSSQLQKLHFLQENRNKTGSRGGLVIWQNLWYDSDKTGDQNRQ